jgi:ammonia channel protein AmtB
MTILNLLVEVVGLSAFVFAAVAQIKQLGVTGKKLTIAGFLFGLVFGLAYRYAAAPMTDFVSWFWAVTFGLATGFLATGAYKGIESATGKDKP